MQTTQMISRFSQIYLIAWSKQQKILDFIWMQIRWRLYFKQEGDISTLSGNSPNLVRQFIYFGSNISSIESDINICLEKP